MNETDEAHHRSPKLKHTKDRFDKVPRRSRRVGVHRLRAHRSYALWWILAFLICTALLTAFGIFTLSTIGSEKIANVIENKTEQNTIKIEIDPQKTVAVLDGTDDKFLATRVARRITSNDWGNVIYEGSSAQRSVAISAVFYKTEDQKGAAEALAQKLGGLSSYPRENQEIQADLIVLLGSDYAGPGKTATAEDAEDGVSATTSETDRRTETNSSTRGSSTGGTSSSSTSSTSTGTSSRTQTGGSTSSSTNR